MHRLQCQAFRVLNNLCKGLKKCSQVSTVNNPVISCYVHLLKDSHANSVKILGRIFKLLEKFGCLFSAKHLFSLSLTIKCRKCIMFIYSRGTQLGQPNQIFIYPDTGVQEHKLANLTSKPFS